MNLAVALAAVLLGASLQPGWSGELNEKPKFGPGAVPVFQSTEFLRSHPAPDYWRLSPFYSAQSTDAGCSLASIAMLINALRDLPSAGHEPLVTQETLLAKVASDKWRAAVAPGGSGVGWAELEDYTLQSLQAYGIDATVEVWRPVDGSDLSLSKLRSILSTNEESDRDIVILAFNQGILTGDANADHVSPLGAYDPATDRVLIMDVDREWYVPYWVSVEKLLQAMLAPHREEVERGGLLRVRKRGQGQDEP